MSRHGIHPTGALAPELEERQPTSRMAVGGTAPRIAVFTHDTFGLGHVRRSSHIIHELSRQRPEAAILLITGSPALHSLKRLPPNADYLKLPTIVQTGAPESSPSHLPIGCREVSSLRKRIIRGAVDSFRPDVFLVDNFPLGSRKELLPTLQLLRELSIPAVLGLRDIVDRPEVVRKTWARERIYDRLRHDYERILVYGLREVLDVSRAYELPPDVEAKVRYCGYVTSRDAQMRRPESIREELGLEGPLVVATVGGGGDGFPLMSAFVRALERTPEVSALAITGPLMSQGEQSRLIEMAAGNPHLVVKDFVSDLPSYLAASDLVVAMGGYNTAAELLALGKWALVMPRNWRYGEHAKGTKAGLEWEQLMRAQAMERMGLQQVIVPETLSPESLAVDILSGLSRNQRSNPPRLQVGGVEQVVEQILLTIEARKRRAQV